MEHLEWASEWVIMCMRGRVCNSSYQGFHSAGSGATMPSRASHRSSGSLSGSIPISLAYSWISDKGEDRDKTVRRKCACVIRLQSTTPLKTTGFPLALSVPIRPCYLAQMGCSSHRNPLPGSAGLLFAVQTHSCWLQGHTHTKTLNVIKKNNCCARAKADHSLVRESKQWLVSPLRVDLQTTHCQMMFFF